MHYGQELIISDFSCDKSSAGIRDVCRFVLRMAGGNTAGDISFVLRKFHVPIISIANQINCESIAIVSLQMVPFRRMIFVYVWGGILLCP